ncbi:MAG: hypothetical protein ACFFG0_50155 [Candidatus Thorarchaeota archaeon]
MKVNLKLRAKILQTHGIPFFKHNNISIQVFNFDDSYLVFGLISSLSEEFKRDNINFNMVMPQRVDTFLTRGENAGDQNKPPGFLSPSEITDYYIFLLSETANRCNFKLLNTLDFETVKIIIRESSTEKKKDLKTFLEELEIKNKKIYGNVKSLSLFIEFLLDR